MVATAIEELERRALKIIEEHGDEGILQATLIRVLGVDSRVGSKVVTRLVKKGIVKREKVTVNGRVTYRLYPARRKAGGIEIKVNARSILDIPCTTCRFRRDCGAGAFRDPATCRDLTEWLERLVKARRDGHNGQAADGGLPG